MCIKAFITLYFDGIDIEDPVPPARWCTNAQPRWGERGEAQKKKEPDPKIHFPQDPPDLTCLRSGCHKYFKAIIKPLAGPCENDARLLWRVRYHEVIIYNDYITLDGPGSTSTVSSAARLLLRLPPGGKGSWLLLNFVSIGKLLLSHHEV